MRIVPLFLGLTLATAATAEEWPDRFGALWATTQQPVGPMQFDARQSVVSGDIWSCIACGFYDHTLELRANSRDPGYTGMTDAEIINRAGRRCVAPNCTIAEVEVAGRTGALVRAVFAPWTVSHRWTFPLENDVLMVTLKDDRNPNDLTTDLSPRDADIVSAIETQLLPALLDPPD